MLYAQKHGRQFVCRGLPFDPATGKMAPDEILQSGPPGLLTKGQCIPFRPDNRDFIPDAPSITVLSGPDAKQAYNCIFRDWYTQWCLIAIHIQGQYSTDVIFLQ